MPGQGRTVLHHVGERGGEAAARLVLALRPDAIDDEDREERTPLFWAAACNKCDRVILPCPSANFR